MLNLLIDFEIRKRENEILEDEPLMIIGGLIKVYKAKESLDMAIAIITEQLHNDVPIIYVDESFMQLSNRTKKFILYHELGHYINGDFMKDEEDSFKKTIRYKLITIFNLIPMEEQKADLYAFYKCKYSVEETISCLNEIRKLCDKIIETDYDYKNTAILRKLKNLNRKEFNERKRLLYQNINRVRRKYI